MKNPIFSVKDNLIGFNAPFIRQNERVALREFRTLIESLDDKADHTAFDLETGVIEPHDPQVVLLATQWLSLAPREAGDYDD